MKLLSRFALLFVACGLLGVSAAASAVEGRHALIVGIGNYSVASGTEPLKGIPKDVQNARRMALSMGVDSSAIVEIRDAQATKPRVLRELDRLRQSVRPGDKVFFYWSGHGARYAGRGGCIEGLQTYTEGIFTENDVLSEAELATYLQPISQVADKVITVIDACFSGGVIRGNTRSIAAGELPRAKFNGQSEQRCEVGVNQVRTRSLLAELSRLGVHQENFVQIASANYDEVSWDTEAYGGFATHSLAQCLLGEATDLDRSGAVSLDEIRTCAQVRMNRLMEPHRERGMLASTLQIKGNRNLVVAPAPVAPIVRPEALTLPQGPLAAPPPPEPLALPQRPPAAPPRPEVVAQPQRPPTAPRPPETLAQAPASEAQAVSQWPADSIGLTKPPVQVLPAPPPVVNTPAVVTPPPETIALLAPTKPPAALDPPPVAGPVGSLATLNDIYNQRDPRIDLSVQAPSRLRIDSDLMRFTVRPAVDGYLYVVLLGSDEKSFYLLFPNTLDRDNRLRANQTYTMPRASWQVRAAGPPGVDRLLFVLSPSPRDPALFAADPTGSGGPFSFSLADLASRQRLIDFFLGRGVRGRSGAMGAVLVDVEEVP